MTICLRGVSICLMTAVISTERSVCENFFLRIFLFCSCFVLLHGLATVGSKSVLSWYV